MPGWHEKLRAPIANGKIEPIGVIQEQHGTRTQLLNQWKQMSMRLLLDPLNRLDVSAVPITLLLDRHGVIRYRNPKPEDVQVFLEREYNNDGANAVVPGAEFAEGDRLVMSGKYDDAIRWYQSQLDLGKDLARTNFRLGVAYRMRFDANSENTRLSDFNHSVEHWAEALRLNPDQYIWRRRIQQYGPVLDKPYPFYNWVATAREEIKARGETPIKLLVEPAGAELIGPAPRQRVNTTANDKPTKSNPDPSGRIRRDEKNLIAMSHAVIQSTDSRQKAARVHLVLHPSPLAKCSWNNEGGPTTIWIEPNDELQIGEAYLELGNDQHSTSTERRSFELEVAWKELPKNSTVKGYALYHACEKETGVCSYLRQDFEIKVDAAH